MKDLWSLLKLGFEWPLIVFNPLAWLLLAGFYWGLHLLMIGVGLSKCDMCGNKGFHQNGQRCTYCLGLSRRLPPDDIERIA